MDAPDPPTRLPPELVRLYRVAVYEVSGGVPPFQMRIDEHCVGLARLMDLFGQDCAGFLTACNPQGRLLGSAGNQARQAALVAEFRSAGFSLFEGFGRDPTDAWPGEASVLVLGVAREACCETGRRHDQNAVVWAGRDAVPRLLLLR